MRLEEALQLIDQLRKELAELRAEIQRLQARIAELEQAAARQAAPFRRREDQKVPPAQHKQPGRKPGHRGAFRQVPAQIDREIDVPLPACPHCGGTVQDRTWQVQYIEELPPVRPEVVRLITCQAVCPACGPVRSTHPLQTSSARGAAKVQLGPRALAVAALLNKQLGLTMGATCRVLKELRGLSVTRGGLAQALERIGQKVQGCYQELLDQLRQSPAVFADETSWWVGGPHWWLWTFTTPQTTVYRVEAGRGSAVVRQTLGEHFAGMLVSDCLSSYDPLDCRKHKCIAHHLRAIHQARDSPLTEQSPYLRQWELLFQSVATFHRLRPAMDPAEFVQRRMALEAWCDRLLAEPCAQPSEARVRHRLAKQREHLLGCLYEPAAEPTNNRAERALRPAVIARKLSCGNKTQRGRRTFEILASLAATCTQQARNFVDYLVPKLPLVMPAG